jgi:fumarylpyruvate hydrolase
MPDSRGQQAGLRLKTIADEMLAEVDRLPAPLITWQPAPDVWSVMDILCHVQEFIPYWTRQALRVIEHPEEQWGRDHTDRDRMAAVTDTSVRQLSDVQRAIHRGVTESADALARVSDAELDREATSKNPRWGQRPAHFIVDHLLVQHVEKHLGQIRRNVSQYQQRNENPSMNAFVFPPPAPIAAPIRGRVERFPIRRIFCVGRNYEAHAKEMGVAADREAPFYFTKAAEHYVASGSTTPYPPGTKNYHYEVELVVAIGTPGFRIAEAHALDHVFGYACGLDMTRRDLQTAAKEKQRPWDIGKDVEQSAVLGEIAPSTDVGHPHQGRIELRVNGQPKQSADLSQLIHSVPAVVAHLSQYYHLQPGDLIYTGTPEGVGAVKPGDHLEGSIEGVGTLTVRIGEPATV